MVRLPLEICKGNIYLMVNLPLEICWIVIIDGKFTIKMCYN